MMKRTFAEWFETVRYDPRINDFTRVLLVAAWNEGHRQGEYVANKNAASLLQCYVRIMEELDNDNDTIT